MLIRPATADDREGWDNYVLRHPLGTPYHRWAWKEALEAGYGVETHYYLGEDPSGSVIAVMPVARVPRPIGRGQLCALPYCDRGEPLAESAEAREALVLRALSDLDAPVVLRGTAPGDTPVVDPATAALRHGQKVRMLLDLPDSADTLLAGFKSKHRSQIRKAGKNGLHASVGSKTERIDRFYPVFARNMRHLGSPTHSREWFRAISGHYGDDCLTGLVELEGRTVGAGIVLIAGTRAAIPWASTLREYNRLAPNMLLYWCLLEAVVARGCTSFDFGRSGFGAGTYRFKAQWGARPVPLHWEYARPLSMRTAYTNTDVANDRPTSRTLRIAAEKIWQRLPLPLTVVVGSRLRPFFSH